MKLPIKYHYSYFILPFVINKDNYDKYIYNILNKPFFDYVSFSKTKNASIYTTFSQDLTNSLLDTKKYARLNNNEKAHKMRDRNLLVFEYNNKSELLGSIDIEKDQNKIYFNLQDIKLYIFRKGICFLTFKTSIDSYNFEDVLDFNYRFKELLSDLNNIQKFQSIMLSDSKHNSLGDFKKFVYSLIDINLEDISKYTNMENLYTFSYTCVENSVWNEKTDPEVLLNILQKYMKVYASSYNADVSKIGADINTEYEYRKIGVTKVSSNLLCSGIDPYNFGYLPVEYETTYLFSYILALFYRISLIFFNKRLNNLNGNKSEFNELVRDINSFNKNYWSVDITNSQRMTKYFNSLIEILKLNTLYLSVISKTNMIYKEERIEENIVLKKNTIFIIIVLIIIILFFKCYGW